MITVEYNNKQIEGALIFASQVQSNGEYYSSRNSQYTVNARLNTPYSGINGAVRAELRKQGTQYSVASQVSRDRRQMLDVEYTVDVGAAKSLSVEMRQPEQMTANIRYSGTDTTKKIYYDMDKDGRAIVLTAEYKQEGDLVGLMFDVELPSGRTFIGTNYTLSATRFAHVLDINNRYISKVEATMESRGRRELIDGSLAIKTPSKNIDVTLSHQVQGSSKTTVITIGKLEPLSLRHDFTSSANDFTSDLIISHSSLTSVSI